MNRGVIVSPVRRVFYMSAVAVAVAAFIGGAGAIAAQASTSEGVPANDPGCVSANVPVTGFAVPAYMHGILCEPPTGTSSTVMVLVPGATYNHVYWDFPYDPSTYN